MKEQFEELLTYIKSLKKERINACITGSCLLGEFEGQDVDIFVYDIPSLRKLVSAMKYNELFVIYDKKEEWKMKQVEDVEGFDKRREITSIKFLYNTCIPVNLIFKKECNNIFSVLSSFDMNIVCKGYDIQSEKELDLTEGSTITKIADWNKWNPRYRDPDIWDTSGLLNQFDRCIKYNHRGINTDLVVKKYIEIIEKIHEETNMFGSEKFDSYLIYLKKTTDIIKNICLHWLENHLATDEEREKIKVLVKSLRPVK